MSDRSVGTLAATLGALAQRTLDIVAGLLGLVLLAPFFAIIALLIRRDSPGPVFYWGERPGRHGRLFRMLKFRTMREAPESFEGPPVTAQDDPRITQVGRWLRDTKLNELPQLWNVLKGDMSLVGPRPENPEIVATWPADTRREILSVRPGITSPASVLYRREESLLWNDDVMATYLGAIAPSKLRLDQLYVRHRSFWLDLDVLFWTAVMLAPKLGSRLLPEDSLFLGPISRLVRRYVNWFAIDLVMTLGAIGLAGALWRSFGPLHIGLTEAVSVALGFSVLFSLICATLGVYRIAWSQAAAGDALRLVLAATLAGTAASLAGEVIPRVPRLPVGMIAFASLLALCCFVVARYRSRLLDGLAVGWLHGGARVLARERVLVVGGGYAGQFTTWLLTSSRADNAFQVVGYVDDDLYKQGIRFGGVSVLGRRADIPGLVALHDIGLIAFAIHNIDDEERANVLRVCSSTSAQVVIMPDLLGSLNAAVSTRSKRHVTGPTAHGKGDPSVIPISICDFCLARNPSSAGSEARGKVATHA